MLLVFHFYFVFSLYFSKLEQFESLHCEKGELYMEYRRMACKEKNDQPCKFCEKDQITSPPLPTRRPYPDYGKLPNFHYLSWSATPTNGREPEDFQPRAQIKRLFEESELVSGDSEAIRRFSEKYIVPEKLVAEYLEHLSQIKMRKEKKKEETERERTERLPNREYNDIDWVGLYNSDKLASLRVDELSLYFSHHKIAFKGPGVVNRTFENRTQSNSIRGLSSIKVGNRTKSNTTHSVSSIFQTNRIQLNKSNSIELNPSD